MLISANEDRTHSIIDFLARPVPIVSVTWQTSDNPNALLPGSALAFPAQIWLQDMWAEKMRGFRFFKADLNFQIQVNASPFDTGRLWAFWSPFDAERGDLRPFTTRTNVTGYPGIEIDVGNMMTANLTIPYCSPYTHIDQTQNNQPYGTFRITVLSQFFSNNDTLVDVTVWCWMTNVELTIPTAVVNLGGVLLQRMIDKAIKMKKHAEELLQREKRMLVLERKPSFRAQSSREGASRSKAGLISGGAEIVGAAAKAFANVPVIGEIAKPLSWVADVTKGVSSLVGLSKPVSVESTQTFAQVPGKGFTHCDGLDESVVLGSKPDNLIQSSFEVFGTKEDEMNIPYIVGKPNWIEAFQWNMADFPKVNPLYKIPIHAGICGTDPSTGFTGTWYSPTHMAMVASAFRYWRGGVNLRFTAVKNAYYSGRLVIVYYPGLRYDDITTFVSQDTNMCPKWIWDVKRDAEIQITIPYASNAQWLRVKMHNNKNATERSALTTDAILGTLCVFVDNRLRGPPTVPDNFWIHVWVSGAADMTFAVPDMVKYGNYQAVPAGALYELATFEGETDLNMRAQCARCTDNCNVYEFVTFYECGNRYYAIIRNIGNKKQHTIEIPKPGSQPPPTVPKADFAWSPFRAQMLKVEKTMDVNHTQIGIKDPEGSSMLDMHYQENMNPEKFCIGELHNNLRPLTRRFSVEYAWVTPGSSPQITFDPAFFFESNGAAVRSCLNYFARMYVFYRGGVRYKALINGTNATLIPRVVVTSGYPVSTSPISYGTAPITPFDTGGRFTHIQYTNLNPVVEVTCPYYGNVPIQLVSKTYITTLHLRMIYRMVTADDVGSAGSTGDILKAASDDFSFGYLVGAPAILEYSAN